MTKIQCIEYSITFEIQLNIAHSFPNVILMHSKFLTVLDFLAQIINIGMKMFNAILHRIVATKRSIVSFKYNFWSYRILVDKQQISICKQFLVGSRLVRYPVSESLGHTPLHKYYCYFLHQKI